MENFRKHQVDPKKYVNKKRALIRGKKWCWFYCRDQEEATSMHKKFIAMGFESTPPILTKTIDFHGWWAVYFSPVRKKRLLFVGKTEVANEIVD